MRRWLRQAGPCLGKVLTHRRSGGMRGHTAGARDHRAMQWLLVLPGLGYGRWVLSLGAPLT